MDRAECTCGDTSRYAKQMKDGETVTCFVCLDSFTREGDTIKVVRKDPPVIKEKVV